MLRGRRNIVPPDLKAEVAQRIEIKTAGNALTHQINFPLGGLTAKVPLLLTDALRAYLPELLGKGVCILSPLASDLGYQQAVTGEGQLLPVRGHAQAGGRKALGVKRSCASVSRTSLQAKFGRFRTPL